MAIARTAVLLAVALSCNAHATMNLEENDWELSTTSAHCFLGQSISAVDAKIQQSTLVLGEVEFVSSRTGGNENNETDSIVRVTTTVKQAAASKKVSIRARNGLSVTLSAHRPGGDALRYVEFNGNLSNALAFARALRSGNTIEVRFHTGLLSRVRGSISPTGFIQRFANFNACKTSAGQAR